MRNITYIKLVPALLLPALLAGCVERELADRPDDGRLKISLTWPDGHTVSGADIRLYGSDGSPRELNNSPSAGIVATLPADTYTLTAVNTDRINATCAGQASLAECRIEADRTAVGTLKSVGNVYAAGVSGVKVIGGNTPAEVTLDTRNMVRRLRFDIDTDGVADIAGMTLRLTGVVPSLRLVDGADAGEATAAVEARVDMKARSSLSADMSVFGTRGESLITADVLHADGTRETSIPQDISRLLDGLPAAGGTISVTLAMPSGGKVSLTVTVAEWKSGGGSGTVM